MKQNAAGLASICILSTMVLLMVGVTFTLYTGMESGLKANYPYEINVNLNHTEDKDSIEKISKTIQEVLKENAISPKKYSEIECLFMISDSSNSYSYKFESKSESTFNSSLAILLSQDCYNKLEQKQVNIENENVYLYSTASSDFPKEVKLSGKSYEIASQIDSFEEVYLTSYGQAFGESTILVLSNEDYKELITKGGASNISFIGIDTGLSLKQERAFVTEVKDKLKKQYDGNINIYTQNDVRDNFYVLYGGLFFLGIFLGVLFMMATVMIIYYKQISEGYEDQERFRIMQQVGMSRKEVKKTIHSQILFVFFLPLAGAIVHVSMAFKMLTKCLAILIPNNMHVFILSMVFCVIIYSVIYTIIYLFTAKAYYRIVK